MGRARAVVLAIALALAAAVPARAQEPCHGDLPATAPAPLPGGTSLRFGIYPGGPAGQLGPIPAGSVKEDQGRIFDALAQLRPPGGPFTVHLYRSYLSDKEDAKEEKEHRRLVDLYTGRGYRVEIVIRYRRDDDVAGFASFVRGVVRRFGANPLVSGFQVTNEVNFAVSPDSSDGAYAGSRDALVEGVIAAKDEARTLGYSQLRIGFNWVYRMDPGTEDSFWSHLRDAGGPRFVAALDWVGLDIYPGTFFPPRTAPGTTGDFVVDALSELRKCFLPQAGIPATTPIHVEENGYPTGPDRPYADQQAAAESMLGALDTYGRTYDVTDYFWFDLRDADSKSPNLQQQYGVMRDDYTPKPALETLRSAFARMSVKEPAKPPVTEPPPPRRARVGLRLTCYSRGVFAYLTGSDAGSASRAVFALGRRRANDAGAPFRRHIRLRPARRSQRLRVKALTYFGASRPIALRKTARCLVRPLAGWGRAPRVTDRPSGVAG